MEIFISILLCLIVFIYSLIKKALTFKGIIASLIVAIIVIYISGLKGLLLLLITFVLLSLADKISKKYRKKKDEITKKNGARDEFQIIANCGIACAMLIVYYFTNNEIYLIAYGVSLASSLADSFASDIGVLSKGKTINIISLKQGDKGLSGNVSVLGLIASLFGSLIIGLSFILIFKYNIFISLFITTLGFLGAYFDSLLGCLIQVKYKCSKCNIITEKNEHCNTLTNYYSGNRIIDNDVVNFLSNLLVTIIALLILK